jgi:hypothetical protein
MNWFHLSQATDLWRVVGCFEHGYEHSGYIRCTEYLDFLRDYKRMKMGICLAKLAKFSDHRVIALKLANDWNNLTNCRGGVQHLFFPS